MGHQSQHLVPRLHPHGHDGRLATRETRSRGSMDERSTLGQVGRTRRLQGALRLSPGGWKLVDDGC
jgi:hypothetical protein